MGNKNNKHLGIEIDPELHYMLHYISKYYGRSANERSILGSYIEIQKSTSFEARAFILTWEFALFRSRRFVNMESTEN